jgi:hypothetical protein
VSRPRRPFGGHRPGQLPATRLKILAAELSDPQRLTRARQYAGDGSVLDITIEARIVTATVLGSRPDPYLVELLVEAGDGPPARADVSASCSCPDSEGQWAPEGGWCKHALSALLVLADEVTIEPEILSRWRGGSPAESERRASTPIAAPTNVVPFSRDEMVPPPTPHPLDALLDVPAHATMPLIGDIELVAPTPIGDAELDTWVTAALAILTHRA